MPDELAQLRQELDRLAARMQQLEEELAHVMGARELRARSRRQVAAAFRLSPTAAEAAAIGGSIPPRQAG